MKHSLRMADTIYPFELQRELIEGIKEGLTREYKPLISSTAQHVWGKEVRITTWIDKNNAKEFKGELENWYFNYVLKEKEDRQEVVEEICRLCRLEETKKAMAQEHPLICQLCEWQPLEDQKGKIIKYNPANQTWYITMVKYALVVDKGLTEVD